MVKTNVLFKDSYLSFVFIYTVYVILLHHVILHFCQAAVSIKISKLLICFCSFDLSCPILEKNNFIKNVYIVLSCLIK